MDIVNKLLILLIMVGCERECAEIKGNLNSIKDEITLNDIEYIDNKVRGIEESSSEAERIYKCLLWGVYIKYNKGSWIAITYEDTLDGFKYEDPLDGFGAADSQWNYRSVAVTDKGKIYIGHNNICGPVRHAIIKELKKLGIDVGFSKVKIVLNKYEYNNTLDKTLIELKSLDERDIIDILNRLRFSYIDRESVFYDRK